MLMRRGTCIIMAFSCATYLVMRTLPNSRWHPHPAAPASRFEALSRPACNLVGHSVFQAILMS